MKSVTISLDEDLVRRARIVAAAEGQSLSRFIRETVERQIDPPMTHLDADERLSAPPTHDLPDENGCARTRDRTCE